MAWSIPYRRFSSKSQIIGNSEVRQDAGFDLFVASSGLPSAPPQFCYWDRGKSGYKGHHRDGDFGRLLADAARKAWPEGSVVWFEDMDRFSRQKLGTVLADWDTITSAGYSIHVGSEGRRFTAETPEMERISCIMKSILAREESEKKAKRLTAVWEDKRRKADGMTRKGRKTLSKPCWLDLTADGRGYVPNALAADVRQAAMWSIQGMGLTEIRRRLPSLGAGIGHILKCRTLVGEWQPQSRGAKREDIGDPVSGYYPALLTEDEFRLLQQAIKSRVRQVKKRTADNVNLFTGLLFNSAGVKLNAMQERGGKLLYRQADRKGVAIERGVVETAILDLFVHEITPDTLGPTNGTPDSVSLKNALARAAELRQKIDRLTDDMVQSEYSSALSRAIVRCEVDLAAVCEEIERIKSRMSMAKVDHLGHVKDLAAHLDGLTGEELHSARQRLAAAIASLVDRITLTIHNRRSCDIVVELAGGTTVRKGDTSKVGSTQVSMREDGPSETRPLNPVAFWS